MHTKFTDYLNEHKYRADENEKLFDVLTKFIEYLKENEISVEEATDATIEDFLENCCGDVNESKKHKKEKSEDKDEDDDEKKEDKKDDSSKSDEEKYLSPKQRNLPEGLKKAIIKRNKKKK